MSNPARTCETRTWVVMKEPAAKFGFTAPRGVVGLAE
jgi:hypothetical protein